MDTINTINYNNGYNLAYRKNNIVPFKPKKTQIEVFDFVLKNEKPIQPVKKCKKKKSLLKQRIALFTLINTLGLGSIFGLKEITKPKEVQAISFEDIYEKNPITNLDQVEEIKRKKQEAEFEKLIQARELDAKLEYEKYLREKALEPFDVEIDLSVSQEKEIKKFLRNWEKHKDKYKSVEQATNVPAELICAIHCRESGANFNKRLHDGGDLDEFRSWEESAIAALEDVKKHAPKIVLGDYQTYLDFAEAYNGTGYKVYHNMESPYIWAGTEKYKVGKYTDEGFQKDLKDEQVGVAVMLKTIYS